MKLFFLFLLIAVSSCTITKRTFRPGYHIEWNKQIAKSDSETNNRQNDLNDGTSVAELAQNNDNKREPLTDLNDSPQEKDFEEGLHERNNIEKKETLFKNLEPITLIKKTINESRIQTKRIEESKKKEDLYTYNFANIFAVVAFVLAILTILILVGNFLQVILFIVAPITTFFLSMISAIASLLIGRGESDSYTLKLFAIISLCLLLVAILLAMCLVVYLFLFG